MRMNRMSLLFFAVLISCISIVFAQGGMDKETAEGCAACGGMSFVAILIPASILVINILILVWVAKDSKARGMGSGVGWMVLVFFTGLIGLIIYLLSRPKGDLIECPNCGNKRFKASAKCPHCGN